MSKLENIVEGWQKSIANSNQTKEFAKFSQEFYKKADYEELAIEDAEFMANATASLLEFAKNADFERANLRVFNANKAKDGWDSHSSILQLAIPDMPFLVNSIRIALMREDIDLLFLNSSVLHIEKNDQGLEFQQGEDLENPSNKKTCLLLMSLEKKSEAELNSFAEKIIFLLEEIKATVDDFPAMKKAAQKISENLGKSAPVEISSESIKEGVEFLNYLLKSRFTFLGYTSFDVNVNGAYSENEQDRLGVLSVEKSNLRSFSPKELENENSGALLDGLINYAKTGNRSRLHRPVFADYFRIKEYIDGKVSKEHHFIGLFTAKVYSESLREIPILREKIDYIFEKSGLVEHGYSNRALLQILEFFPRNDLFKLTKEETAEIVLNIFYLHDRPLARVFINPYPLANYYSVLVYVPKENFSTALRRSICAYLEEELEVKFIDSYTYIAESNLARVQFFFRFTQLKDFDLAKIQAKVADLALSWQDKFEQGLISRYGAQLALEKSQTYKNVFSMGYKEDFAPEEAVAQIDNLEILEKELIGMNLYQYSDTQLGFHLFHRDAHPALSNIIPKLECFGFNVLTEDSYDIRLNKDLPTWLHNFKVETQAPIELNAVKANFEKALSYIWQGFVEADDFNRLVISANLDWQEANMLRALAGYMQQVKLLKDRTKAASALINNPDISFSLVNIFKYRFDLELHNSSKADEFIAKAKQQLADLNNLEEYLLLKNYLQVILAIVRTNYYQKDANGAPKRYVSFKISSGTLEGIPLPKPLFEIYVFSAYMEGVHLRGGKVARGGIRWSNRHKDFRSEILNLVKAQQVKNATIVPVGSKGGFIGTKLPSPKAKDYEAKGIECYKTLMRGLLDITDNLVKGELVAPKDIIRLDEDDPYLAVAADKGTATFSDIANGISGDYGFWLGDAFASGGSNGYDHKELAITARGAWESVKRHFREMGRDCQTEPFTVVGIGSMYGDVFGNGMLLSEQIKLLAAFNSKHIFLDPNPDVAVSFKERQRLAKLPDGTSWDHYDTNLISAGGGVFSRQAKAIPLSEEIKIALAIETDRESLTPTELMLAIIKAPVDLWWNGAIGTYTKSKDETNEEVGDTATADLRVNGEDLRCLVVGEGANLGLTQRGRIEAALNGVRLYTDFIDNVGGVNCSDHEVNLKIMMDKIVQSGELSVEDRNKFLATLDTEVADLVVADSYRQATALAIADLDAKGNISHYQNLINHLEEVASLDRKIEFLPTDEEFKARIQAGQSLTRPELGVILAYTKANFKVELVKHKELLDGASFEPMLAKGFPKVIYEKYRNELLMHPLKYDLIATMLGNEFIDNNGITTVYILEKVQGLSLEEIVQGYLILRQALNLPNMWKALSDLDNKVDANWQIELQHKLGLFVRKAIAWLAGKSKIKQDIEMAAKEVKASFDKLLQALPSAEAEKVNGAYTQLEAQAQKYFVALDALSSGLNTIGVSEEGAYDLSKVAQVALNLSNFLQLDLLTKRMQEFKATTPQMATAKDLQLELLEKLQGELLEEVIKDYQALNDLELSSWQKAQAEKLGDWFKLIQELETSSADASFAVLALDKLSALI